MKKNPRIQEILSGIILLAARRKEPIPVPKIYSILHAMKAHESVLSGIRFSLTGAVCYSREIDQAIDRLTDDGFLKSVGGSVLVGENVKGFGEYLSGFLTKSQIEAVHSVSIRFHDRLRRDAKESRAHP